MDRVVEGSTDENILRVGGGILIPVESPGIGPSQATMLEDAQALDFFDIKHFYRPFNKSKNYLNAHSGNKHSKERDG